MIDERLSKLTDSEKADRLRLWESIYFIKMFCGNNDDSCCLPNCESCPAKGENRIGSECSFKRHIPAYWEIPKPPTPDFVRCMECTHFRDEPGAYACEKHNCIVYGYDGCTMGDRKEDEE